MTRNKSLEVYYHDMHVGTLAEMPDKRVAFQYDSSWIQKGFSINPLALPLESRVFVPEMKSMDIFDGLFGVFADSLPDSWGKLLLDNYLKSQGISVSKISVLDRLSYIGSSGMGALEYRPARNTDFELNDMDFDTIAMNCNDILSSKPVEKLDALYKLGGSSSGTRPKILIEHENKDWILKFPAKNDPAFSGICEYDYSLCAKKCEITMPETKLISSKFCDGYFMTERFDRNNKNKIFTITFAGLLDTDFRAPTCDYSTYMRAIQVITKDNIEDKKQMYRMMCFNVLTHNRDDHTKNFSFTYTEDKGWRLSPAYDLTFSDTFYGEQTTSVNGKGNNITHNDMITVGTDAGLSKEFCRETLVQIHDETKYLQKYFESTQSISKHITWSERLQEISSAKHPLPLKDNVF